MAANSKQKIKLMYVYRMLNEQTDATHGLSMKQILENLEEEGISAERKGIYRDLDILREFGCTINTIQRNPVEYTMESGGLTLDELSLLVDAVQSSKFLTQQTSNRLVKKISELASTHQREALQGRVHVDGRIKSQNESVFYNVNTIHEAMRQKRKIEFLYYKYDNKMERVIQHGGQPYVHTPVQVVYVDGLYYVITYSDNQEDFVRFRADRMRLVQVSKEKATRNARIANYDLEDFAYQAFGMFDGKPTKVKLAVEADAMDIIADRFGTAVHTKALPDGGAELSVTVRKSRQFFGWIAGMDGAISIAGPKALVDEYRTWLKDLAKRS